MNFIEDKQLIEDARGLGFDGKEQCDYESEFLLRELNHGYTLEQLERWLWEKYRFFIFVDMFKFSNPDVELWNYPIYESPGKLFDVICNEKNPFVAHLEGVKKAIEYLKGKP